MKVIGLDLSINSTGVCINKDNKKFKYYIITNKTSRAYLNFDNKYINIRIYNKLQPEGDYTQKESTKTRNIYNIVSIIEEIIKKEKPDCCNIEGISYGSRNSGALVDLAGLNFMVRQMLIKNNINYNIISPTANKKFAVGNGGVEKDVIVNSFLRLNPYLTNINKSIKLDDIADAYFLSCNND